ncbi:MAG TPA: DUF4159 domain-containing protein [Acetobacteraceae bacterium]|nr:DUF4159 domain-containing protein [Acetobacteraceae bacterium]
MIFAAPWVLLTLPALPLLWWLLRVTPPAPRSESFPAIRLLMGLHAREETPARTPWWLLLLRMIAATLVILALARPVLDAGSTLAGSGPVLLVVDNGWASAGDWLRRMQAANTVLDRAERAGRQVALLATAPDGTGAAPQVTAPLPVADLRARVAALHPEPWPPNRAAAALALRVWHRPGTAVVYLGDGLTHGGDFAPFAAALGEAGMVTELRGQAATARVLLPPQNEADRLIARIAQAPQPLAGQAVVLAQSGDGRTLARATFGLPAGTSEDSVAIVLPPELRNRLSRLVLEGPPSAASVVLLDERWRRRPVGILAGDLATADTPFAGSLYYLRRALLPFTEVREADLATLLQREVSVLILADRPLPAGAERDALTKWVEQGGLLIRFAGPRTAEQPIGDTDSLMPVKLLGGDRQLGGALSWAEPAGVAQFSASSPFAGLTVPDEVKVSRQVLAEPSADLTGHTWAALADGTPLVTQATRGAGRVVLFHVTANADWSNLPLSGLFVDMLRRLVALSAGVAPVSDTSVLAPAETLDGFGLLSAPPQAATGLPANEIARTAASPRHPPGLYGPENGRRALNLGANLPAPEAAPPVPGARIEDYAAAAPERALGPALLAIAVALLALDLLIALGLRGLLRPSRAAAALLLGLLAAPAAQALDSNPNPALATRLGYMVTGDAQLDAVSRAGLEGLSEYVNRRTAATLVEPDAVEPGKTDLSFYPLLYWPITADAQPLSTEQAAALNDYMSRGGIVLVDTRDSGSGAGFAPGTGSALQRVAQGLVIPPLAPLTTEHVLARAFYLLQDFPGRYTGESVWVQRDQDRTNDSVSPVIIGGNDWAAAWAVDENGRNPYAVIPGGSRQRTVAYRFGVNLVMYALTGNYKGDQVHVPAILQRLGQ